MSSSYEIVIVIITTLLNSRPSLSWYRW